MATMATTKRRSLGRGLGALLGQPEPDAEPEVITRPHSDDELQRLPVDLLQRGKYQPRIDMRPETLQELADSIKAQGVVQPIVVRPLDAAGGTGHTRYEIIAGERRWRAAQLAGLHEIPAVVRRVPDEAAIAMALIENIQRENLNPLEEARALDRLITEFDMTHATAAEAVGRSRAAVSNLLRLLELTDEVKTLVEHRELEMGHARALLTLPPVAAEALAQKAAEQGWTVRELEERARHAGEDQGKGKGRGRRKGAGAAKDPNVAQLERELAEKLGAKVAIVHGNKGRGRLVIEYFSLDELDGILERIH